MNCFYIEVLLNFVFLALSHNHFLHIMPTSVFSIAHDYSSRMIL